MHGPLNVKLKNPVHQNYNITFPVTIKQIKVLKNQHNRIPRCMLLALDSRHFSFKLPLPEAEGVTTPATRNRDHHIPASGSAMVPTAIVKTADSLIMRKRSEENVKSI